MCLCVVGVYGWVGSVSVWWLCFSECGGVVVVLGVGGGCWCCDSGGVMVMVVCCFKWEAGYGVVRVLVVW